MLHDNITPCVCARARVREKEREREIEKGFSETNSPVAWRRETHSHWRCPTDDVNGGATDSLPAQHQAGPRAMGGGRPFA